MAHDHQPGECKEVFSLLSQYLDAELPEASCAEIEAHLADCPPCIEFLQSLKKSIQVCRDCGSGEQPSPLDTEHRGQLLAAYRRMLSARRA